MARKDALLRLHERLIAKRDSLRRMLDHEMSMESLGSAGGDVVDAANDDAQSELSTQLAALETEELWQVERAIQMIRAGRYGRCEMCEMPIPLERLKALPFTSCCVECQRQAEESGETIGQQYDWESAYEHEGHMNDRELSLSDIDIEPEA